MRHSLELRLWFGTSTVTDGYFGFGSSQVSPHEFMQIVMKSSNKRFTIEQRGDPVEFWSWFLNSLHLALTGGKRKKASVVSRCFQVIILFIVSDAQRWMNRQCVHGCAPFHKNGLIL